MAITRIYHRFLAAGQNLKIINPSGADGADEVDNEPRPQKAGLEAATREAAVIEPHQTRQLPGPCEPAAGPLTRAQSQSR